MFQLSLQQMAQANKRRIQFVPLPEFAPAEAQLPDKDGTLPANNYGVHVMSLTVEERDDYEKKLAVEARKKKQDGVDNFRARFIARTICDEAGNRIATDGHWEIFAKWDSAPMSRVFDVAAKLSGITDNDIEAVIEELKASPNESGGSV